MSASPVLRHRRGVGTAGLSSSAGAAAPIVNYGSTKKKERVLVHAGLFSCLADVGLITNGESESNLVDSASSHTLVSKIKPCMSKYNSFTLKTANGSLYQL